MAVEMDVVMPCPVCDEPMEIRRVLTWGSPGSCVAFWRVMDDAHDGCIIDRGHGNLWPRQALETR